MFKKTMILVSALMIAPTIWAASPTKVPKTHQSDPRWTISVGLSSEDGIAFKDFDYFLKGKYSEGRVLYSSLKILRTPLKRFRFHAIQGVGVPMGAFKPFVELYYDYSKAKRVKAVQVFGYSGGVAYRFDEMVSLSASVHNFVTKHPSITVSGIFNLTKNITFMTSLSDSLPMKDKTYAVSLGYSFG